MKPIHLITSLSVAILMAGRACAAEQPTRTGERPSYSSIFVSPNLKMLSIPSYAYLIGASIVWAGLMITWARHIHELSERRRVKAVAQGETAPDIKGVSNYERAELRESAHRALLVTPSEQWISRGLFFGVPAIIAAVFLTNLPS